MSFCSWLNTKRPTFTILDKTGDLLDMTFKACESSDVLPGNPLIPDGRYEELDLKVFEDMKIACKKFYGFVPFEKCYESNVSKCEPLHTVFEYLFPNITATGFFCELRNGYVRVWAPSIVVKSISFAWKYMEPILKTQILWIDDMFPTTIESVIENEMYAWVNDYILPDDCTLNPSGSIHVDGYLTDDLREILKQAKPVLLLLGLKVQSIKYAKLNLLH